MSGRQPPPVGSATSASPCWRESLLHSGVEGLILRTVVRESVLKNDFQYSVGSEMVKIVSDLPVTNNGKHYNDCRL